MLMGFLNWINGESNFLKIGRVEFETIRTVWGSAGCQNCSCFHTYHRLCIYESYLFKMSTKRPFESCGTGSLSSDTKQLMNHCRNFLVRRFYRCVGRSLMCKTALSSQMSSLMWENEWRTSLFLHSSTAWEYNDCFRPVRDQEGYNHIIDIKSAL